MRYYCNIHSLNIKSQYTQYNIQFHRYFTPKRPVIMDDIQYGLKFFENYIKVIIKVILDKLIPQSCYQTVSEF